MRIQHIIRFSYLTDSILGKAVLYTKYCFSVNA